MYQFIEKYHFDFFNDINFYQYLQKIADLGEAHAPHAQKNVQEKMLDYVG